MAVFAGSEAEVTPRNKCHKSLEYLDGRDENRRKCGFEGEHITNYSMKIKSNRIISLFAAAGIACGGAACKKEILTTEPASGGVPAESESAASASKRAQTFGFASRLPSDIDGVIGLRNFDDVLTGFTGSQFFKRIVELSGGAADPAQVDEITGQVSKYAGKDAFIAFANGSAAQLDRLMEVYDYYYRVMYPMMLQGAMAGANGGGAPAMDPEDIFRQAMEADGGKMLKLAEELQIPGMIMGSRFEGGTAEALSKLAELEGQLPPTAVVSEIDVEGADSKFKSWRIAAKDALGEAERAAMREEFTDEEIAQKLEKIIDSKTVEVAFGSVGDYLIMSIGENHDHLKLAAKPDESLLSIPRFAFADGYLDKKIISYYYTSKDMADAADHPEQMLAITGAVQDFLSQMAEGGFDLGDTGKLIGKAGELLVKMSKKDTSEGLGLAYLEDGIKIESIGGYSSPGVDPKPKLRFANVIAEDTFLGFTSTSTAEHEDTAIELMETLVKAMHEGASKFAELQPDSEFGQGFGQMNAIFAPKLLDVWTILRDKVQGGLGHEAGLYIDLKGAAPKIPNLPQVLVNNGKVPRVAFMYDVKDRAKLAEGWAELVPAINEIAKLIPGQEPGKEFQLPDTISSEKGSLTTHFMGLPFTGGDFLPSVSVSDEVFFMSSSKTLSESLSEKAKPGEQSGVVFQMSFDSLRVFASDWVKLVMENADDVFAGDEFQADSFKEQAAMMQIGLDMMKAMKKIRYHSFVEDNEWRASAHIQFSDIAPKVD